MERIGRVHMVKGNETLEGIALAYDRSPASLRKYNRLGSSHLYPGQVELLLVFFTSLFCFHVESLKQVGVSAWVKFWACCCF